VKFIVNYPEIIGSAGDMLDSGPVGRLAAAAESAGLSGFSLTEHPIPSAKWLEGGGHQTIDPFVGLAFAAAATSRIRLLTYLAVVPYRNPFILAKAASTLDRLSAGRLDLGIGAGYQKGEFFALGVDIDERSPLVQEALEVLPMAWSGTPFSYHGLHFDAREVVSRPPALQQPIPIWIGGNSTQTLKRVAERAQGWMPLAGPAEMARTNRTPHLGSTQDLATRIAQLRDLAGDRASTLAIAYPYLDRTIAEPDIDVGRHQESFAELGSVGVTHLTLEAPAGSERAVDFVVAFGANFISQHT
jgi:probable F420-dependent oxidoreductase